MARFVALRPRSLLLVAAGSLLPAISALWAAPPATNAPPVVATTNGKPAPPALPPPMPDTFGRYGNILEPGTEPAHPLKLELPFPDVGEVKVPNDNELNMREKLEQLAVLSDDQIRDQLSKWPPFTKMSLRDEAMMLARIQDFRDYRYKIAQKAAHALGLNTLTPQQQAKFEQEYWAKRLPMERALAKKIQPIVQQTETQLNEQLYREFSSPVIPVASNPPKPPPGAAKPSPAKPASSAPIVTTTNATMQIGANGTPLPMH